MIDAMQHLSGVIVFSSQDSQSEGPGFDRQQAQAHQACHNFGVGTLVPASARVPRL